MTTNTTHDRSFVLSYGTEKIEGAVRVPGSELDADRLFEWTVGRVLSDLVPSLGLMKQETVPLLASDDQSRSPVLWALANFYSWYRFEHALEKADAGSASVSGHTSVDEGNGQFELDVTVSFAHTDDRNRAQAMLDEWLRILRGDTRTQIDLMRGDLAAQHLSRAFGLQSNMPQRYKLFGPSVTGARSTSLASTAIAAAMYEAAHGGPYPMAQQPATHGDLLDQLMRGSDSRVQQILQQTSNTGSQPTDSAIVPDKAAHREHGSYQPGELGSTNIERHPSPES